MDGAIYTLHGMGSVSVFDAVYEERDCSRDIADAMSSLVKPMRVDARIGGGCGLNGWVFVHIWDIWPNLTTAMREISE